MKRDFFPKRERKPRLQSNWRDALQEHSMKTRLIICNEADYLQAHMTFLVGKPRVGNPMAPDPKQRVTSLLKKWILQKMRA